MMQIHALIKNGVIELLRFIGVVIVKRHRRGP